MTTNPLILRPHPLTEFELQQQAVDRLWNGLNNSVQTTDKLYFDQVFSEHAVEMFGSGIHLQPSISPRYRPITPRKARNRPLAYTRLHPILHQLDKDGAALEQPSTVVPELSRLSKGLVVSEQDERTIIKVPSNPPPTRPVLPQPSPHLPAIPLSTETENEIREFLGIPTVREQVQQAMEYKEWVEGLRAARQSWQRILPFATCDQLQIEWAGVK